MKGGSEGFQGEISRMIQDRIRQAHEVFEQLKGHGQKEGERLRKQIAERFREAERHINEKIKELRGHKDAGSLMQLRLLHEAKLDVEHLLKFVEHGQDGGHHGEHNGKLTGVPSI